MIGDEIFDIAGEGFAFAHFDEFGVMVAALAGEDAPVIEACGVAFEVPFTDDTGVITGGLKVFGDSGLGAIEAIEDGDAVAMGVEASHERGSAGGADGIGDEGVGEASA